MTKAATALRPTAFPLSMMCLLVPPRFHRRPQLLTRRECLLVGRDVSSFIGFRPIQQEDQ
jgi:hypothetical protein